MKPCLWPLTQKRRDDSDTATRNSSWVRVQGRDTDGVNQRMHEHEVDIDVGRVRALLSSQCPQFGDASLTLVEPWGTDNALWRVGDAHVVRLPRIEWATAQVDFEAEWLPRLAPHLDVAVPEPLFVGEPGHGYPYQWAIHTWLVGQGAGPTTIADSVAFALDLAAVVRQLQSIDAAPARSPRNRARHLAAYDGETRAAIRAASHLIDAPAATAIWEEALDAAPHAGPSVWVHGDLEGNCITLDGHLSGLVDWGSACAGDPAVDIQVIWSPLFTDRSRIAFLDALQVDEATVLRSRGAAINQACAALPYYLTTYPLIVERSWHKLAAMGVERHVPAAHGGNEAGGG